MQSVCSPHAVRLGAAVLRQLEQHVRHPSRHLQIEGTGCGRRSLPCTWEVEGDDQEFQVVLSYAVSLRAAWATSSV